jgi:hypothetical protein
MIRSGDFGVRGGALVVWSLPVHIGNRWSVALRLVLIAALAIVISLASGITRAETASEPEAALGGPSASAHTVALVDPTQGIWHLYDGGGRETMSLYYGDPGDFPIVMGHEPPE